MRKLIEFMMLCSCMGMLIACSNSTKETNNDDEQEEVVELEVVVKYGPDSTFKQEYQINKTNNQKHGWYKEYDKEGHLLVERTYVENRAEGIEKSYYITGELESEMQQKKGMYDGNFKYYYEDGTLKQEGTFVQDKMEGLIKTYYSDGTLKEEVTLVANLTQGPFKEYNENGTLKTEGGYTSKNDREALEEGELKKYDENGELIEKMICREGQCCRIWTKEEGDVKPSSKLCEAIIKGAASKVID